MGEKKGIRKLKFDAVVMIVDVHHFDGAAALKLVLKLG